MLGFLLNRFGCHTPTVLLRLASRDDFTFTLNDFNATLSK